jgi:hypothetical protein
VISNPYVFFSNAPGTLQPTVHSFYAANILNDCSGSLVS